MSGRPPFPFVVGSGRSGTTLVRAMLDAHPELAVPDEVAFIVRYARPHYAVQYGWPRRFDGDRAAELIVGDSSFRRWPVTAEEVQAAVRREAPATYADLIRRIYSLAAAQQGKARYADKTPMHVFHVHRLARLLPESRFVHVVRDGRDVATSYLGVRWGPTTVEEAAVRWRRSVEAGRRAGRSLAPHRYHELRYEELVGDPRPVLRGLCTFIQLDWHEAMLRHHERATDVIESTKFPEAHDRLRLPPTLGLRNWRNEMAPADVARFESIAGDMLVEMGYERTTPPPSIRGRANARARVARTWTRQRSVEGRAAARVVRRWVHR